MSKTTYTSSSQYGVCKVDGTTITSTNGVIKAASSGGNEIYFGSGVFSASNNQKISFGFTAIRYLIICYTMQDYYGDTGIGFLTGSNASQVSVVIYPPRTYCWIAVK